MLELESVRIGKCYNWKVSELECVVIGTCHNWKVSECIFLQNWKLELEIARIIWSLKIPYK